MSRTAASSDIDTILRDRLVGSVDRILRMMSTTAKSTAIASVDVPTLMLSIARELPVVDGDEQELADEITDAITFKRDLIDRAGGALSAEKVQALLGHKSAQAVYKAVKDRRLLAVDDRGTKLFPVFQFDGDSVRPGLARVLAAAPNTSGWALLQFFVGGDEGLGTARPIDLLKGSDADIERLARFARTLED